MQVELAFTSGDDKFKKWVNSREDLIACGNEKVYNNCDNLRELYDGS